MALITTRQTKEPFAVLVTDTPLGQHKLVTPYDGSYVSPLYHYDSQQSDLFNTDAGLNRQANLSSNFIAVCVSNLNLEFVVDGKGDLDKTCGPEDIFAYAYAVFHSPEYRSRYAEFLKIDFPRLPLTSNLELFCELVRLGDLLVKNHLLKRDLPAICVYPEDGDNVVEAVRFDPVATAPGSDTGSVWINSKQYFDNVQPKFGTFTSAVIRSATNGSKTEKAERWTSTT